MSQAQPTTRTSAPTIVPRARSPLRYSRVVPRRLALAALALAACFTGDALLGEPCVQDADCGPSLRCADGGLCGEFRCPATPLALPNFAPDITLIVAYTESMARVGEDGVSRWDQAYALAEQLAEQLGDRVNLGVQVVPSLDAQPSDFYNPCYTDASTRLLPAPAQGAALLATLPAAQPALGEHALRGGLDLTLAGFVLQDPDALRPQAIVIISDPPLNCSEVATDGLERVELFDGGLVPRVAAVAATGVPVFVVGIGVTPTHGTPPFPGARTDEVDPHLAFNALAEAGGQARPGDTRYYRPEDSAALIATLAAIPPAFADCRVPLEDAPAYPDRLVVTIEAASYSEDPGCTTKHGWRYPDPDDLAVIELCPDTCARFRVAAALTIEQRCPSL